MTAVVVDAAPDCVEVAAVSVPAVLAEAAEPAEAAAVSELAVDVVVVVVVVFSAAAAVVAVALFDDTALRCSVEFVRVDGVSVVRTSATVVASVVVAAPMLPSANTVPHMLASRISAIAKGVRRTRSRFGGRLEPFFRLRMDLHEGRGELLTVTGAQTVDAYPRLRGDARALDSAARACDAVGRLFETGEPHPGVFNLLCRHLALLDELVSPATMALSIALPLLPSTSESCASSLMLASSSVL